MPSQVSNWTITLHITYMAGVISTRASVNHSGSLFTACWMIGKSSFDIVILWRANIVSSLSNIRLQSWLRRSHFKKQLTYSSLLSTSELLLWRLGVAGQSGFGVPIRLWSVGFSWAVLAYFTVGPGGIVLASVLMSASGIIPASFSAGRLVPSSHTSLARYITSPPTLLPPFSFPLVDGVGGGSILLISGDRDGMGISWSVVSTNGEIVPSWLAWSWSSMAG